MSPKPMRLVNKTLKFVSLKGYEVEVMTPLLGSVSVSVSESI